MSTEIATYLSWLNEMRQSVRDVVVGLDADGLNWTPLSAATNSIYALAQHCAWVEEWWIGTVLAGRSFPHTGAEDFAGAGADATELLDGLEQAARSTHAALEALTSTQLDAQRTRRRADGTERTVAVRWIIVHVIEHYAEHIGQMRLTRQLWEATRGG